MELLFLDRANVSVEEQILLIPARLYSVALPFMVLPVAISGGRRLLPAEQSGGCRGRGWWGFGRGFVRLRGRVGGLAAAGFS
jgi:hypothetical protein